MKFSWRRLLCNQGLYRNQTNNSSYLTSYDYQGGQGVFDLGGLDRVFCCFLQGFSAAVCFLLDWNVLFLVGVFGFWYLEGKGGCGAQAFSAIFRG